VVQPHPGAKLAKFTDKIEKSRPYIAAPVGACRIFYVDAVGGGVLRDDEKLLDARRYQALGFAQHVGGGSRDEIDSQLGDNAEAAAVVAALGDLQIRVVARR